MSTNDLKTAIHQKIETLSSVGELLEINHSLDLLIAGELSAEEKAVLNRLSTVVPDAENGKTILHVEVQKTAKQWLRKR